MNAFRDVYIAQQILGNFFMICIFLAPALVPQVTSSTISSSVRLSESKATIRSPSHIFELGIFRKFITVESTTTSPKLDDWYVGIWYKRFPKQVVWVANRDRPFHKSAGMLKISNSSLILVDDSNDIMWQDNYLGSSSRSLEAELLDNGNFVIRDSNTSGFLWQSFDTPTDTFLPGMKMESEEFSLTSWMTSSNPSVGEYTYETDMYGKFVEGLVYWHGHPEYRRRPSFGITENRGEVTQALRQSTNASYYAALRLFYDGSLSLWAWTSRDQVFKSLWKLPSDGCYVFNTCGPNMYCEMNPKVDCKCLEGFQESEHVRELKTHGCVRISELSCFENEFLKMSKTKLPTANDDSEINVEMVVGLEECKKKCVEDCECTAFAIANTDNMRNGSMACALWTGPLKDIRTYNNNTKEEGHDLYLKLAPAHLKEKRHNKKKAMIIGFTVGGSGLLVIISLILLCWGRIKQIVKAIVTGAILEDQEINQNQPMLIAEDLRCTVMEFDAIATATNNFAESNKLGIGGFGVVYKGRLIDGQEIAVKKLSKMSRQAIQGFENEVKLIGVIQHVNLVRLLGYVSTVTDKLLVYEYLENLSLDTYLFDTTRSYILTWDMRFDIINGIVRGLVYLHQDSRFKIIHLDIKPNNILLGKDMVPKISDFGMVKTLERDVTEGGVTSVAGTFGYMSPEYRMDSVYSAKSDVFSFGVMLLEIISGKKNREFPRLNNGDTLQSYIWSNWSQGKGLEIVDPVIKDSSFRSEQVLRCIQIGLLCVQQLAEDRPTMSSVALMLGSQTEAIAQPKNPNEIGSSSSLRGQTQGESSCTVPQVTMSIVEAR